LRQALLDAQPYDTITFDPTVFPPDAPVTIFVSSEELPHIHVSHLTLDASNAGVILDGSQVPGEWIAGLQIVSSQENTIMGLQISHFPGPGIAISGDSKHNVIGGDRSVGVGPFGQGNQLSHNSIGINLSTHGTTLNTITGNLVGTNPSGAAALGNHRNGIWITEGAHKNTIGPDNIIAFNDGPGIDVQEPDTVENTFTRNSIHNNSGIAIKIDLGIRSNYKLPVPIILIFDLQAGTLTGDSCAYCIVEIFSDNSDEGAIYEGQTTADGMGVFTFNKEAPFSGPHLTATATDTDGNTSEFSPISGTVRSLIFQHGNNLPRTILQLKEARELESNRMGINWGNVLDTDNWKVPLAQLNAWGVKRVDMGLSEKEPPIDWSTGSELAIPPGTDYFIDGLAEIGVEMDLMLHFYDKAGHAVGEELSTPRFQTEQQIQDYVDFVRFVVRYFKGRIPYYTIWSEPDYCGEGGIKCILPEDYIELVRQVVPVIRQEDPEAKIVSAPYVLYFAREDMLTLLSSDVVSLFDVISWHPIYDATPNHEFFGNYYYEYPAIIQEIKGTAAAHGFAGEYWGTDLSWTSDEMCNFPGCRGLGHSWEILETDLQVAKYYARMIVMELGMDVVVGLDNFMDDRPWSFSTMRNLNTVMAGNRPIAFAVDIESEATNIMSFGFSLPNGERLFALWTNGVTVDDDPGVSTTLTFPDLSAQNVVVIDVLHGFEQELITESWNGNLVIRNLLVKDYPILIRFTDTTSP